MYFFNQKDDYSAIVAEQGSCFSVHFTTFFPVETESFCVKVKFPDKIFSILEKIEYATLIRPSNDNLAFQHLYELFDVANNLLSKKYSPTDARVLSVKEYIDAHFMDKYCLSDAINVCNISQRRLNDLFKKQYNITLNKYIVFCKIRYAKTLIKLNYLSIAEISEMCGFSDVFYFSKVFKAETGYSPNQYKSTL